MAKESSNRIWDKEESHTFVSGDLRGTIREIDARVNGSNMFTDITRTLGLITLIEYYSEVARTNLKLKRAITYAGGRSMWRCSTYYNDDTTEDSVVTETVVRDVDGNIVSCDSVLTTTEVAPCA